jgi:hypothetical protein
MNVRKVCTLILAVFTSLIILSGYSTSHHGSGGQLIISPSLPSQVSDGGSPALPYPPKPSFGTLIADGGGPAPPYPPSLATYVV